MMLGLALGAALPPEVRAGNDEAAGPAGDGKEPAGEARAPARPGGAGKEKAKIIIRGPREKAKAPPSRVALPGAGSHGAEEMLALAGALTGLSVRLEGDRVSEVKFEVARAVAGELVDLAELTVLLAAHGVYLFRIADPREGEILVASRNPSWREEAPSFTKLIETAPEDFTAVWKKVEREVEARNARLPKGAPRITAVSSPRTGKVFIRAWRPEDIAEIEKAVAGLNALARKKDAERPRLYTHQGRFRKVEELADEVLERLQPGERNLVRFVISGKGNRLLYRAPAAVGEKVKALLEDLDGRRKPGPAGEP